MYLTSACILQADMRAAEVVFMYSVALHDFPCI